MTLFSFIKKVIIWRLLILVIAFVGFFIIKPSTGFTMLSPTAQKSDLSVMWSNFDGLHYLSLAEYGYGYPNKTDKLYAFFPVYPWLINNFNFLGSYLFSGLFISHLFLILALYFLHKLVLIDENEKIANLTILLILIFPTALFLGSVYTESLFLFLSVLCFYLVRKKYFFLACLIATIASATRITGVFLWPVILYEYWIKNNKEIKSFFKPFLVWLFLPPLGLLSYLKFQWDKTGDALFFAHIQTSFTGRTTDKIIMLYQVFYRYFRMLLFTQVNSVLYFTVVLEFLSAILILGVIIFSIRKMRFSYWIYIVLSFLLPSFSGTFASLPRYILVLFPMFIYLAKWLDNSKPLVIKIYFSICVGFSIACIILFTRGYFIS